VCAQVTLTLDYQPHQYQVPQELADVLGVEQETKARLIQVTDRSCQQPWCWLRSPRLDLLKFATGQQVAGMPEQRSSEASRM
jgi:hypothetical protein